MLALRPQPGMPRQEVGLLDAPPRQETVAGAASSRLSNLGLDTALCHLGRLVEIKLSTVLLRGR